MSMRVVDNRAIELVNEDKILFSQSHISKSEIITYYERIAPYMLPFIYDHPIAMNRFPDGINQEGFYQKDAGSYFPSWIKTVAIKSKQDAHITRYVLCNNPATLVYLANQATITIHTWLSAVGTLHYPSRMVFDLDPVDIKNPWPLLIETAHALKKELETHGLIPFIMTTGSKGLHVVVPLTPTTPFSKVKKFTKYIAAQVCAQKPTVLTIDIRKKNREQKIFIDTLRNQWAQLAVAPYSLRAREKAPIATPLSWSELNKPEMGPQRFTIHNIFTRLGRTKNPWHDFFNSARALPTE